MGTLIGDLQGFWRSQTGRAGQFGEDLGFYGEFKSLLQNHASGQILALAQLSNPSIQNASAAMNYLLMGNGRVTISPNVMTASSFWLPVSKKTGQDTGLNGAGAMTASPVLAGSGYDETCIVGTTFTPLQCITSDADALTKYVMFWVTGDTALCGARQLVVNFEGTQQTFNIPADAQWDPVKKRYGVPVAFQPRAGYSGLARFRAKGVLQNGYERVIQGDLWFNYPGTTNYFDRDANAIYVSGIDLNGSGAKGTRTASAGTAIDPNDSAQRAMQYAHDAAGNREGCYIYVKGDVIDPVAAFTRPTTTLGCELRPWPGFTSNQVRYSGPGRDAGKINHTNNKVVIFGLRVNSDSILGFENNASTEMGFRACVMEGTVDGGDDIYGWPKGLVASVGGVSSQEWIRYTSGADTFMEDCTGTMHAPTGIRRFINCEIKTGWDTFYGQQNSAGRVSGFNYWWAKFDTPAGRQAKARFHTPEQLTVAGVVYDAANDWTKITWSDAGAAPITNVFETHIVFLTGAKAGTEYFGGQTYTASWPNGATTGVRVNMCAITGASLGSFPDANTAYIKGQNLVGQVVVGDLFRVFNIPHKDAAQYNSTSDTQGFIEHGYFQNYALVADDPQPGLYQQNSPMNPATTVSVTGTTATFSAAVTLKKGHFISITSGANVRKYAMVTADVTAATTANLDRADLNGTAGATWQAGRPVKDFVFENFLCDKTSTGEYLMQFQSPAINVVYLNATIIRPSATNSLVHLADTSPGFGARGLTFRDSILGTVKAITNPPPSSGITWDKNHYYVTPTVTDVGASIGVPSFNSMGSPYSGYLPTSANVATIDRVLVPYDTFGNIRAVGQKRGAVVN